MLNLRITEFAEARIGFSGLRTPIPGYGMISRVHTSESAVSIRIRSARLGAKVGMLAADMWDWERPTGKDTVD